MPDRTNATGSKTCQLLAKAEPISNSGIDSGKRKKPAQVQLKRGVRICERNESVDDKVSKEGERGGAAGAGAEIPLQPLVQTTVRPAVPLQTIEVHGGTDINLQPMEPMLEQVNAQKRL
ncbi:hypothetical protein AV530_013215 [Patagioenas fasciata monilis]|uniref:Protein pxr1-like n=1 Tax=Patagioenas fasciata monilis TaxID=372326 RepID=A0A1V4JNI0_PATFA|nr:hypothetical protein AV530_013215 [Patagioenas fasciata monilis]